MAFLSLSRGDPAARDLLQRAIRARYGPRPPALDSLRLTYESRGAGPFGIPVKLDITEYFLGKERWKWVETQKLLFLTMRKLTQRFDGTAYSIAVRRVERRLDSPPILESYRRRLWGVFAAFLTPLTQEGVTLSAAGERTFFAARDSNPVEIATVVLNSDYTVASVTIPRFNPRENRDIPFVIRFEGGLQTIRDFVAPKQIVYEWDAGPETYAVMDVEANPQLSDVDFAR